MKKKNKYWIVVYYRGGYGILKCKEKVSILREGFTKLYKQGSKCIVFACFKKKKKAKRKLKKIATGNAPNLYDRLTLERRKE